MVLMTDVHYKGNKAARTGATWVKGPLLEASQCMQSYWDHSKENKIVQCNSTEYLSGQNTYNTYKTILGFSAAWPSGTL